MSQDKRSESTVYRIKIKEELDKNWKDWFSNLDMTIEKNSEGNPVTILSGAIRDQSALNGLLNKIWGLNLTVLSVKQISQ
jgi:hypothetical protein